VKQRLNIRLAKRIVLRITQIGWRDLPASSARVVLASIPRAEMHQVLRQGHCAGSAFQAAIEPFAVIAITGQECCGAVVSRYRDGVSEAL
jgi:hypothetical protein